MSAQDETVYLPGDLQIVEGRVGETVTLAAHGEIDMANAPELDAALVRAEESDAAQIILDLSAITFIDSCGLRVLLVASRRSTTNGKRFGMRLGDGQVARMMKFTAIDQAVNVLD
jgi:anti-sigma B factor antagonist